MSAPPSDPTRAPARRLLPKIGLLLGTVFVAFGLCEIGARLMFPAPPDGSRLPQLGYKYDREIRYVLVPGQRGWIDDGWVTVNSMGFRGPEVPTPKPAGRFRIAVIGDSVTFGWGVNDDETFSARLEQLLRAKYPNRPLDVVNLGVGGFDTRQEVTLLKRYLSRLQPDLVLVGFYTNDVPDTVDDNPTDASGATRIAAPHPEAGGVMHMNPTPSGRLDRMLRKSRAIYVIGRAINRFRGAGEWGMARFAMELDVIQGHTSPALEAAWTQVAAQFDDLHALAELDRFEAGIIVLPCRELVLGQFSADAYLGKIRSLAEPRGLDVINPLPVLTAAVTANRKATLFIPYDRNHPSLSGHELIAQAIFQYLESHPALMGHAR